MTLVSAAAAADPRMPYSPKIDHRTACFYCCSELLDRSGSRLVWWRGADRDLWLHQDCAVRLSSALLVDATRAEPTMTAASLDLTERKHLEQERAIAVALAQEERDFRVVKPPTPPAGA